MDPSEEVQLSPTGRWAEALTVAEEAVSLDRELAAVNRDAYLPHFARSLGMFALAGLLLDRSPMERVRQPKTPKRLIPVLRPEETTRVLDVCRAGRDFAAVRDYAIVRMLSNTGARLSEVAGLKLDDIDMDRDVVTFRGKGRKDRQVRLGPKTARALSRYLRVRARHPGAHRRELWLSARGSSAITANAVKLMLQRRGEQAGVANLHAHRWRHTFAHEWKLAGGDSGDLMLLLGWASEEMAHHYGASAAAERAREVAVRLSIGDDL